LGLVPHLDHYARFLLKASNYCNWMGSGDGGMHMIFKGKDKHGTPKEIRWFIIAKDADGPEIPCIPAIILARKLVTGRLELRGVHPCVGLVTLEEYLEALKDFAIQTVESIIT